MTEIEITRKNTLKSSQVYCYSFVLLLNASRITFNPIMKNNNSKTVDGKHIQDSDTYK